MSAESRGFHVQPHFLLILAAVSLLAAPARASAQPPTPVPSIEVDLGRFVVLCPSELEVDCRTFAAQQSPVLDSAYDQLRRLYGVDLTLPINIRLYVDQGQYASLNAVAPVPADGSFHTHPGSREIALIGPLPDGWLTSAEAPENALRHELDGLFLMALSGGHFPPGLELGVNQYFEKPGTQTEQAIQRLQMALPFATAALLPWPDFFALATGPMDPQLVGPQALSIAAYLADRFGFPALIELARVMADGRSQQSALAEVFGQPMDALERDWRAYLPSYVAERWQHNALYNYDLQPFEAALDAGAYSQTAAALDQVLPFLEQSGQAEALARAQALRARAQDGLSARDLTAAYAQAMQAGDYAQALDLAKSAQAAYAALGDASTVSAIGAHIERLQKLLDARDRLAQAQELASRGDLAAEQRLAGLASELQALGDSQGQQQAAQALNEMYARRSAEAQGRQLMANRLVAAASALAVVLLALAALGRVRQRGRPEPDIL